MEENQKKIDDQQKKMAEERLQMIEEQMKIEHEKQKLKKKEDKKAKTEQKMILGKDNSRPKLSFAIANSMWSVHSDNLEEGAFVLDFC